MKPYLYLCLMIIAASNNVFAQQSSNRTFFRIAFYNVENLFDCRDDSTKLDNEFLPEGNYHWTPARYYDKLNKIARVIVALGEWETPEIVGLCEIENRFVLDELLAKTPLSRANYRIIHKESPDRRGIDVALLYRSDEFVPLVYRTFNISFVDDTARTTRDILYVKGTVAGSDTLHIFVNHWPSKYGGQFSSEPLRIETALVLRKAIDSIQISSPLAKIIVMGDFNDESTDLSITQHLAATSNFNALAPQNLYNLAAYHQQHNSYGSLKYQGKWSLIDQFIVSGSLLNPSNTLSDKPIYLQPSDFYIFNPAYLLENDEATAGERPFRTFNGYTYNGGFSDHLPVFINLRKD